MLNYRYTYLFGTLICMAIWVIFYVFRKDLRRQMLTMSILIGIVGLFYEYFFWLKDWWHPMTITGTKIGIEDFLLGFSNGGMAAVLYEVFFRRTLYRSKSMVNKPNTVMVFWVTIFLIAGLFWVVQVTSFWATVIAIVFVGIILLGVRKDLFASALLSGIMMALVALVIFLIIDYMSPGWVSQTWQFQYLSGIRVLGAPIEDLIFYFLVGFTCGPYYECRFGERLRRLPTSS